MITTYEEFAVYQTETNPHYVTPAFANILKERTGSTYRQAWDCEKKVFYGFYGQFHKTLAFQRYDVTWQEISDSYDRMYSDFSLYGTE